MVIINGIKATQNDFKTLCEWLTLGKIKITFFRRGAFYTNIITD